jgi:hypothetical protein
MEVFGLRLAGVGTPETKTTSVGRMKGFSSKCKNNIRRWEPQGPSHKLYRSPSLSRAKVLLEGAGKENSAAAVLAKDYP